MTPEKPKDRKLNSSPFVGNPFLKKKNRDWEIEPPKTLQRAISPPQKRAAPRQPGVPSHQLPDSKIPGELIPLPDLPTASAAAVEAGTVAIRDHLAFFAEQLSAAVRPSPSSVTATPPSPSSSPSSSLPRRLRSLSEQRPAVLSVADFADLYARSQSPSGRHFVVHQHDHPVAGTHYDLRLQISESSSVSFAIMYGLPGNPNSRRLSRNATETRVHNLWNHLIETGSHSTGSMLIWDTGEYEVLPPRRSKYSPASDSDSQERARPPSLPGVLDDDDDDDDVTESRSEQEKLARAFRSRKIRLRLHGTRLPPGYALSLRLTKKEDRSEQPAGPRRKRRRKDPALAAEAAMTTSSCSSSSSSPSLLSAAEAAAASGASGDSDTGGDGTGRRRAVHREQQGLTTTTTTTTTTASELVGGGGNGAPPASGRPSARVDVKGELLSAMEKEIREHEDEQVRRTNAYPGATNSVGSIHQRRWYLSLDREACGFERDRGTRRWHRRRVDGGGIEGAGGEEESRNGRCGFEAFVVGGKDSERSVVTRRLGDEVLADAGVKNFRARKGWRPVLC